MAHGSESEPVLLSVDAIQPGIDKYVTDTISTVYGERLLAQMFRLNQLAFTNKDVQTTFRVGTQSARTRIQSWESAGTQLNTLAQGQRKGHWAENLPTSTQ